VIILFSQQPFTSDLIYTKKDWFKYEWIWAKPSITGFLNAGRRPLLNHENILIFAQRAPKYNPQKESDLSRTPGKTIRYSGHNTTKIYNEMRGKIKEDDGLRFPRTILQYAKDESYKYDGKTHPSQKPVALLEYLIKTYTDEGDTVLDCCMGSGSTGVACINTKREFIGIEIDSDFFKMAKHRLMTVPQKLFY